MVNFMTNEVGRRLSLFSNMAAAAEMQLNASEHFQSEGSTELERVAFVENANEAAKMRGHFENYLLKYLAVGGQYADESDPYKLRSSLVGHAAPLDAALVKGGLPHNGTEETIRQRHAFYQALLDRKPDGHALYTDSHADQFDQLKEAIVHLDRKNLMIFNEMRHVQPEGLNDVYFQSLGQTRNSPLALYGPRYFKTTLEDGVPEYEIIKDIEGLLETEADPLAWLETEQGNSRQSDRDNAVASEVSLGDWIGVQSDPPGKSNILPFKLPTHAGVSATSNADQQSQPPQSVSASLDEWATNRSADADIQDTAQSSSTVTKRSAAEAGLEEQHNPRARGRVADGFSF